jgi:hypothetical protein
MHARITVPSLKVTEVTKLTLNVGYVSPAFLFDPANIDWQYFHR